MKSQSREVLLRATPIGLLTLARSASGGVRRDVTQIFADELRKVRSRRKNDASSQSRLSFAEILRIESMEVESSAEKWELTPGS